MSSGVGRWIVVATVLGSGMAAIDASVVGIALPSIGRQFHATFGVLQWMVTGYSLTLAALLLVGGTLGDRFGRRRVFSIGVVWFTLASAACALSPDPATPGRDPRAPGNRRRASHAWEPRNHPGVLRPR
jgi:MFS family permease